MRVTVGTFTSKAAHVCASEDCRAAILPGTTFRKVAGRPDRYCSIEHFRDHAGRRAFRAALEDAEWNDPAFRDE